MGKKKKQKQKQKTANVEISAEYTLKDYIYINIIFWAFLFIIAIVVYFTTGQVWDFVMKNVFSFIFLVFGGRFTAVSIFDYILSAKRALIESVNNILKNHLNIDHTRHRSPINFLGNLLSGLVAYCFRENKSHIDISIFTNNSIILP